MKEILRWWKKNKHQSEQLSQHRHQDICGRSEDTKFWNFTQSTFTALNSQQKRIKPKNELERQKNIALNEITDFLWNEFFPFSSEASFIIFSVVCRKTHQQNGERKEGGGEEKTNGSERRKKAYLKRSKTKPTVKWHIKFGTHFSELAPKDLKSIVNDNTNGVSTIIINMYECMHASVLSYARFMEYCLNVSDCFFSSVVSFFRFYLSFFASTLSVCACFFSPSSCVNIVIVFRFRTQRRKHQFILCNTNFINVYASFCLYFSFSFSLCLCIWHIVFSS